MKLQYFHENYAEALVVLLLPFFHCSVLLRSWNISYQAANFQSRRQNVTA